MNDRPRRWPYVSALVAAPLLMAVAVALDPTPEAADTEQLLGLVAERPQTWSTALLLFFLSGLLWIPAGLGLLRAFGRRWPLGRAGAGAVLVGGAALVPLDAASLHLAELATSGVPLGQQVAVVDGVEGTLPLVVAEVVHVVALFAGLLLVAIGLLRSRTVPLLAPGLVLAALVGLVAAPHRMVETASMVALVVAFATIAVRVARMSEDEWRHGLLRAASGTATRSTVSAGA